MCLCIACQFKTFVSPLKLLCQYDWRAFRQNLRLGHIALAFLLWVTHNTKDTRMVDPPRIPKTSTIGNSP